MINSEDPDDMRKVNLLKEEAQELEDEREATAAKKYFAKMQLEGERPTKFFCNMKKKRTEKAQFEELHIVEKKPGGEEQIKVITDQKLVEWEVRKFYWKLYQDEEKIKNIEEILKNIASIKKVSEDDKVRMDVKISEEEVGNTLKSTKNNIAPGHAGFGGGFYKVFWKFLKKYCCKCN